MTNSTADNKNASCRKQQQEANLLFSKHIILR